MKKGETKLQERLDASATSVRRVLDRTDCVILKALQYDASISSVTLATKVNPSPPACLRRVKRFKELRLIEGIVVLLDLCVLDLRSLVMIDVVLNHSTSESFTAFGKAVQKVLGCLEYHVVTGEFDYFILICTEDNEIYNRLHTEQSLYPPGVRQIQAFMMLRRILLTMKLSMA